MFDDGQPVEAHGASRCRSRLDTRVRSADDQQQQVKAGLGREWGPLAEPYSVVAAGTVHTVPARPCIEVNTVGDRRLANAAHVAAGFIAVI